VLAMEIRIASSEELISENAISQIASQIDTCDEALKFLFFSSNYSIARMQNALNQHFKSNIVACTTAGEISPLGYSKNSVVAASIKSDLIKFKKYEINDLQKFNIQDALEIFIDFEKNFGYNPNEVDKYFGILVIDGMSYLEEKIIALLAKVFSPMQIVGGSAGDDSNFVETYIFNGGELRHNTASFVLVRSDVPFRTFKTQYFVPTDKKVIVTEANPKKRIIYEINGERAAIEYANILNIPIEELNANTFAKHPLMIAIGGNWYVRSISHMNDDFSLTFFSAIDVGLVLNIANTTDVFGNYRSLKQNLVEELGELSFLLCFDCIQRRQQLEQDGLLEKVASIFSNDKLIGFSTYGEQYRGMHVNQTLTGVAFGK